MKTDFVGPFNNPFKATIEALNSASLDTLEFMTHMAWDAIGYYDFHNDADKFLDDTLEWILTTVDVRVTCHSDGFYAKYIGD